MVGERPPPDSLEAGPWYPRFERSILGRFHGPTQGLLVEQQAFIGDTCRDLFRFGPGRTDNPCDRYHFWSLHTGGANFAFADGSVRYLPYSTQPIMIPLATRNGGETVSLD